MRIAFLGNHSVPYSSESHEAASYEALGHTVLRIQEGETKATDIARIVKDFSADLFHHVQTYGLAISGGTADERHDMLEDIKSMNIPTVAYHLDLWRNLEREANLSDPYFQIGHFFSTDGGDNELWDRYGINHHYLPPGVYHAEAYDGTPRREFTSDVAFVGSWRSYGHQAHEPTRMAMLDALRRHYGRRFKCFPLRQAIRGTDLTDLYASVKVCVGDSCLAGQIPGFWSDRVPECTGRGGFLIHPYVCGLLDHHPGLVTFEPGNWNEMISKVDHFLANDTGREELRRTNSAWTREHHTYKNKMQTVIDTVFA